MKLFKHLFLILFTGILAFSSLGNKVHAAHIIGGDIYWECISSGSDAGKFIFFFKVYRDCSVLGSNIDEFNQYLTLTTPTDTIDLGLTLVHKIDVTQAGCGLSCSSGEQGAVEESLFATAPIEISGVPPANGYAISYQRCCRNPVDNLVEAQNEDIYYTATMYPYEGKNTFPCYDSSPQFAESPASILCTGYELRYNNNATDANYDSLSYVFIPAIGGPNQPVQYETGYSFNNPLPGPNQVTLDPATGQMNYDSPPGVQGRWNIVLEVSAWRCGQILSKTIREMTVTIIPCSPPNSVPQVTAPLWTVPATANGYAVTVLAGELVNFSLTASDFEVSNGSQELEFTVEGSQFGDNLNDPNSTGCIAPCATLTNVTPPITAAGDISTTFNWQTACDHIAVQDECATFSNTYNFIFTFKDNYCPARASNSVNVAVTVLAEPTVPSPVPHCVSVDANGDVTITWDAVTDNNVPPSFVEYAIFHSTSANGPYQEVGAVANISSESYTHTSANSIAPPSSTGPNHYRIRTRSGCNDNILDSSIDTVSSIFLTVIDAGTTAELSWTPVATPLLSSSNGIYHVYQEFTSGSGAWTEIGTTIGLTFSDPITWCGEELVAYRIELEDNGSCISVSNIDDELLENPNPPEPQAIDSVTVDPFTGLVTICWSPNPSPNVVQYNVFVNPNQFAWEPIDIVLGYNNTCWTDPNPLAQSQSLWYQVTATNTCGDPGVPAGSIIDNTDHHETMFLQAVYDSCLQKTQLDWNAYWYWEEGIKEYEIYTSKDSGPFIKIGTASDTTFIHDGLENSAEYCYVVRAVKDVLSRITSTSSKACIIADVPKRPDYGYNFNATVLEGNTAIVDSFFVDNNAGYLGFEVQRGTNPQEMNNLWFIDFDPNSRYYGYTDNSARPESNSYYYSIIGVDNCNMNADTMNMSRTMLLEVQANNDRTNDIQWNAYEGWGGNVVAYNIYRSFDGPFVLHTTVPFNQFTYTDSVQEILTGEGRFCYYIEAIEGIGASIGPDPTHFMELSRSNEACALQHPDVFIPNAFAPEGVNQIFKPITRFVDVEDYSLQIYSRWGQLIFESKDSGDGWNGTSNGANAQPGVYGFTVRFVSSGDKTFSKSGTITLIR